LKNEIVLVVPNEEAIIKSFDDLKSQEDFIFAMGEPDSVPAGKYASEVLDYLELSEVLSEKTVLAKDVKEVLTWVELGEADAGMVYATDAYVSDKVTIAEEAPAGSQKIKKQQKVLLNFCIQKKHCQFLKSMVLKKQSNIIKILWR
jgi:molybdate transport system substrate-binding protein